MLQHQQQPQMAQMYPQVHVSHFPNIMPYRQIISPVYLPQMAMPGYSSNPAYPHPSNGSNYLLMPGGSSHLSTNGLKYGIQQFKPVPTASPTGFGNFTSPAGYAINAPSVVGSVSGLEDSSRMKYKDGNLYVSNQQVKHFCHFKWFYILQIKYVPAMHYMHKILLYFSSFYLISVIASSSFT